MGNHNIGLEGPIKLLISTKKRRKQTYLPLFHGLGGAIKRGCVEIFSFIFPPRITTSENINIFTAYYIARKNIDIFTGHVIGRKNKGKYFYATSLNSTP